MTERRPALTQAALAERVGVTQTAVATWLHGSRKPYEKHVQKICLTLGIRRDWLLYGEGEKYLRAGVVQETPMPTGYSRREKIRYIEDHAPELLPLVDEFLGSVQRQLGGSDTGREQPQKPHESSDPADKSIRGPRVAQ